MTKSKIKPESKDDNTKVKFNTFNSLRTILIGVTIVVGLLAFQKIKPQPSIQTQNNPTKITTNYVLNSFTKGNIFSGINNWVNTIHNLEIFVLDEGGDSGGIAEGSTRCNGNTKERYFNGNWQFIQNCSYGCSNNSCNNPPQAQPSGCGEPPSEVGCESWLTESGGKCKIKCNSSERRVGDCNCEPKPTTNPTPHPPSDNYSDGDMRCNGNNVEVYLNHHWQQDDHCSYGCNNGSCNSNPSPKVSCGEYAYDQPCQEGLVKINNKCVINCPSIQIRDGDCSCKNKPTPTQIPNLTEEGTTRCFGDILKTYYNHKWETQEICEYGCQYNLCKLKPQETSPESTRQQTFPNTTNNFDKIINEYNEQNLNTNTHTTDPLTQLLPPCPIQAVITPEKKEQTTWLNKIIFYIGNWILRNVLHTPKQVEVFPINEEIKITDCDPSIQMGSKKCNGNILQQYTETGWKTIENCGTLGCNSNTNKCNVITSPITNNKTDNSTTDLNPINDDEKITGDSITASGISTSVCNIHKSDPGNYANCIQAIINCGQSCVEIKTDNQGNKYVDSINWEIAYGYVFDAKNKKDTIENYENWIISKCNSEIPNADCSTAEMAAATYDSYYGTNISNKLNITKNNQIAEEIFKQYFPNKNFVEALSINPYLGNNLINNTIRNICNLHPEKPECAKNYEWTPEKINTFIQNNKYILNTIGQAQTSQNIEFDKLSITKISSNTYQFKDTNFLIKKCKDNDNLNSWCIYHGENQVYSLAKIDGFNIQKMLDQGINPINFIKKYNHLVEIKNKQIIQQNNENKILSLLNRLFTIPYVPKNFVNNIGSYIFPNVKINKENVTKIGSLYQIKIDGMTYIYNEKNGELRSTTTEEKINIGKNRDLKKSGILKTDLYNLQKKENTALWEGYITTYVKQNSNFDFEDETKINKLYNQFLEDKKNYNPRNIPNTSGSDKNNIPIFTQSLINKAKEGLASIWKVGSFLRPNKTNQTDPIITYNDKDYTFHKNDDKTITLCSTTNKSACISIETTEYGIPKSAIIELEKQETLKTAYSDFDNKQSIKTNTFKKLQKKLGINNLNVVQYDDITGIALIKIGSDSIPINTNKLDQLDFDTIREIQIAEEIVRESDTDPKNNQLVQLLTKQGNQNINNNYQVLTSGQNSTLFSTRFNQSNGKIEITNENGYKIGEISPLEAAKNIRNNQRGDKTDLDVEIFRTTSTMVNDINSFVIGENKQKNANITINSNYLTRYDSIVNSNLSNETFAVSGGFKTTPNYDGTVSIIKDGFNIENVEAYDIAKAIIDGKVDNNFNEYLNSKADIIVNQGVFVGDKIKGRDFENTARDGYVVLLKPKSDKNAEYQSFKYDPNTNKMINIKTGESLGFGRLNYLYNTSKSRYLVDKNQRLIKSDSALADNDLYDIETSIFFPKLNNNLEEGQIITFAKTPGIYYKVVDTNDSTYNNIKIIALGDSSQQVLTYDSSADGGILLVKNGSETLVINDNLDRISYDLGNLSNFNSAPVNLIPDYLKKSVVGDREDFAQQYEAYRKNEATLVNLGKIDQDQYGNTIISNEFKKYDFISAQKSIDNLGKWDNNKNIGQNIVNITAETIAIPYNNITKGRAKEGLDLIAEGHPIKGTLVYTAPAAGTAMAIAATPIALGVGGFAGTAGWAGTALYAGIGTGLAMGTGALGDTAYYCDNWHDLGNGAKDFIHLSDATDREKACFQSAGTVAISYAGSVTGILSSLTQAGSATNGLTKIASNFINTSSKSQATVRGVNIGFNTASTAWFGGQTIDACTGDNIDAIQCGIMIAATAGSVGRLSASFGQAEGVSNISTALSATDDTGDVIQASITCAGALTNLNNSQAIQQCIQSIPAALSAHDTVSRTKNSLFSKAVKGMNADPSKVSMQAKQEIFQQDILAHSNKSPQQLKAELTGTYKLEDNPSSELLLDLRVAEDIKSRLGDQAGSLNGIITEQRAVAYLNKLKVEEIKQNFPKLSEYLPNNLTFEEMMSKYGLSSSSPPEAVQLAISNEIMIKANNINPEKANPIIEQIKLNITKYPNDPDMIGIEMARGVLEINRINTQNNQVLAQKIEDDSKKIIQETVDDPTLQAEIILHPNKPIEEIVQAHIIKTNNIDPSKLQSPEIAAIVTKITDNVIKKADIQLPDTEPKRTGLLSRFGIGKRAPPELLSTNLVEQLKNSVGTDDFNTKLAEIQVDGIDLNDPAIIAIKQYHNDILALKTNLEGEQSPSKIDDLNLQKAKIEKQNATLQKQINKYNIARANNQKSSITINELTKIKNQLSSNQQEIVHIESKITTQQNYPARNAQKIGELVNQIKKAEISNQFRSLDSKLVNIDPVYIKDLNPNKITELLAKHQKAYIKAIENNDTTAITKSKQELDKLAKATAKDYPDISQKISDLSKYNPTDNNDFGSSYRYIKREIANIQSLAKKTGKIENPGILSRVISRLKKAPDIKLTAESLAGKTSDGSFVLKIGDSITPSTGKQIPLELKDGDLITINRSGKKIKIDNHILAREGLTLQLGDKIAVNRNGKKITRSINDNTKITIKAKQPSLINKIGLAVSEIFKPGSISKTPVKAQKTELASLGENIKQAGLEISDLITHRVYEINNKFNPDNLEIKNNESIEQAIKRDLENNDSKTYRIGKTSFTFKLDGEQIYLIKTDRNPADTAVYFSTESKLSLDPLLAEGVSTTPRQVELVDRLNHSMRIFEDVSSNYVDFNFKLFGQESGVKNQSELIISALLEPNGALIKAITGSGKSAVLAPYLSIAEQYLYGKTTLQVFKSKSDMESADAQFSKQMYSEVYQKLFNREPKIVDINKNTKLEDYLGADIVRGDTDLFYSFIDKTAKDPIKYRRLLTQFTKNRSIIADEIHITFALTEYVISAGNTQLATNQLVYNTPITKLMSEVEELKEFKELKNLDKNRTQTIINSLGIKVTSDGKIIFANKKAYTELVKEIANKINIGDAPESVKTFLEELKTTKDAGALVSELRASSDPALLPFKQQLDLRLNLVEKVGKWLTKTPEVDYGIRDGMVVLKEGGIETGRKLSNPFDAIAQEYIGQKLMGNGKPKLEAVTIQAESLGGTNAARVTQNFERIFGFSGTVEQVAPMLQTYGMKLIDTGFDPETFVFDSQNAGHKISKFSQITNIDENTLTTKLLDQNETHIAIADSKVIPSEIIEIAKKKGKRVIIISDPESKPQLLLKDSNGEYQTFKIDSNNIYNSINELKSKGLDLSELDLNKKTTLLVDDIFNKLRDLNVDFTHIYKYGTHYGTDYNIKGQLIVITGDNTNASDFYQAIGRDRAKDGNFIKLEVLHIGAKASDINSFRTLIKANDIAITKQKTFQGVEKAIDNFVQKQIEDLVKANSRKGWFSNQKRQQLAIELENELKSQNWIDYNPNPEKIKGVEALKDTIARKKQFLQYIANKYDKNGLRGFSSFKKNVQTSLNIELKSSIEGDSLTSPINKAETFDELIRSINDRVSKDILPNELLRDSFKAETTKSFDIASAVKNITNPEKLTTKIEAIINAQAKIETPLSSDNGVKAAIKTVVDAAMLNNFAQHIAKDDSNHIEYSQSIISKVDKWTIVFDDSNNLDYIMKQNNNSPILFNKSDLKKLNTDNYILLTDKSNNPTITSDSLLVYVKDGKYYAQVLGDKAGIITNNNLPLIFNNPQALRAELDKSIENLREKAWTIHNTAYKHNQEINIPKMEIGQDQLYILVDDESVITTKVEKDYQKNTDHQLAIWSYDKNTFKILPINNNEILINNKKITKATFIKNEDIITINNYSYKFISSENGGKLQPISNKEREDIIKDDSIPEDNSKTQTSKNQQRNNNQTKWWSKFWNNIINGPQKSSNEQRVKRNNALTISYDGENSVQISDKNTVTNWLSSPFVNSWNWIKNLTQDFKSAGNIGVKDSQLKENAIPDQTEKQNSKKEKSIALNLKIDLEKLNTETDIAIRSNDIAKLELLETQITALTKDIIGNSYKDELNKIFIKIDNALESIGTNTSSNYEIKKIQAQIKGITEQINYAKAHYQQNEVDDQGKALSGMQDNLSELLDKLFDLYRVNNLTLESPIIDIYSENGISFGRITMDTDIADVLFKTPNLHTGKEYNPNILSRKHFALRVKNGVAQIKNTQSASGQNYTLVKKGAKEIEVNDQAWVNLEQGDNILIGQMHVDTQKPSIDSNLYINFVFHNEGNKISLVGKNNENDKTEIFWEYKLENAKIVPSDNQTSDKNTVTNWLSSPFVKAWNWIKNLTQDFKSAGNIGVKNGQLKENAIPDQTEKVEQPQQNSKTDTISPVESQTVRRSLKEMLIDLFLKNKPQQATEIRAEDSCLSNDSNTNASTKTNLPLMAPMEPENEKIPEIYNLNPTCTHKTITIKNITDPKNGAIHKLKFPIKLTYHKPSIYSSNINDIGTIELKIERNIHYLNLSKYGGATITFSDNYDNYEITLSNLKQLEDGIVEYSLLIQITTRNQYNQPTTNIYNINGSIEPIFRQLSPTQKVLQWIKTILKNFKPQKTAISKLTEQTQIMVKNDSISPPPTCKRTSTSNRLIPSAYAQGQKEEINQFPQCHLWIDKDGKLTKFTNDIQLEDSLNQITLITADGSEYKITKNGNKVSVDIASEKRIGIEQIQQFYANKLNAYEVVSAIKSDRAEVFIYAKNNEPIALIRKNNATNIVSIRVSKNKKINTNDLSNLIIELKKHYHKSFLLDIKNPSDKANSMLLKNGFIQNPEGKFEYIPKIDLPVHKNTILFSVTKTSKVAKLPWKNHKAVIYKVGEHLVTYDATSQSIRYIKISESETDTPELRTRVIASLSKHLSTKNNDYIKVSKSAYADQFTKADKAVLEKVDSLLKEQGFVKNYQDNYVKITSEELNVPSESKLIAVNQTTALASLAGLATSLWAHFHHQPTFPNIIDTHDLVPDYAENEQPQCNYKSGLDSTGERCFDLSTSTINPISLFNEYHIQNKAQPAQITTEIPKNKQLNTTQTEINSQLLDIQNLKYLNLQNAHITNKSSLENFLPKSPIIISANNGSDKYYLGQLPTDLQSSTQTAMDMFQLDPQSQRELEYILSAITNIEVRGKSYIYNDYYAPCEDRPGYLCLLNNSDDNNIGKINQSLDDLSQGPFQVTYESYGYKSVKLQLCIAQYGKDQCLSNSEDLISKPTAKVNEFNFIKDTLEGNEEQLVLFWAVPDLAGLLT